MCSYASREVTESSTEQSAGISHQRGRVLSSYGVHCATGCSRHKSPNVWVLTLEWTSTKTTRYNFSSYRMRTHSVDLPLQAQDAGRIHESQRENPWPNNRKLCTMHQNSIQLQSRQTYLDETRRNPSDSSNGAAGQQRIDSRAIPVGHARRG